MSWESIIRVFVFSILYTTCQMAETWTFLFKTGTNVGRGGGTTSEVHLKVTGTSGNADIKINDDFAAGSLYEYQWTGNLGEPVSYEIHVHEPIDAWHLVYIDIVKETDSYMFSCSNCKVEKDPKATGSLPVYTQLTTTTTTPTTTTQAPTTTTIAQAPTTTTIAQAPTTSTTAQAPTASTTAQAPTTSTTPQAPTTSTTPQAPTTSTTAQAPTTSTTAQALTTTVSNMPTTTIPIDFATFSTSCCGNKTSCECQCKSLYYDNTTGCILEDIKCVLTVLRELLIVKTETLSSFKNTKISAYDGRASSQMIGASGIVILIIVGLTIVVPDLFKLIKQIKKFLR